MRPEKLTNTESERVGLKMRKAKIIREAWERGEITEAERNAWMDDLKRPEGFFDRVLSFF